MNTLPIYFHKTVLGIAKAGEVHKVSSAFAKNVLIPKQLGSIATREVQEREAQRRKKQERAQKKQEQLHTEVLAALEKGSITISAKADDEETLYAGIKPAEISAAIKQQYHLAVPEGWIHLAEPIKKLGTHPVQIEANNTALTLSLTVTRL